MIGWVYWDSVRLIAQSVVHSLAVPQSHTIRHHCVLGGSLTLMPKDKRGITSLEAASVAALSLLPVRVWVQAGDKWKNALVAWNFIAKLHVGQTEK